MEKTDYPDKSFDLIYSRYALQHVSNISDAIQEFCRLLRSNGRLIYIVTHPDLQRIFYERQNCRFRIIDIPLFNSGLTVQEVLHEKSEYLNNEVLEGFTIIDVQEKGSPSNIIDQKVSDYLLVSLRKSS